MSSSQIDFTRKDSLAVITLNRPQARNALSPDMVADMGNIIADCRPAGDSRGDDYRHRRGFLRRGRREGFCG